MSSLSSSSSLRLLALQCFELDDAVATNDDLADELAIHLLCLFQHNIQVGIVSSQRPYQFAISIEMEFQPLVHESLEIRSLDEFACRHCVRGLSACALPCGCVYVCAFSSIGTFTFLPHGSWLPMLKDDVDLV